MNEDDQLALFGTTNKAITKAKQLSADRRRTERQQLRINAGIHPLSGEIAGHYLPLHPEAASGADRASPGRRCGNCIYRTVFGYHNRSYGKCTHPTPGARTGPRISHSAATDCRAWWPACRDHNYTQ